MPCCVYWSGTEGCVPFMGLRWNRGSLVLTRSDPWRRDARRQQVGWYELSMDVFSVVPR